MIGHCCNLDQRTNYSLCKLIKLSGNTDTKPIVYTSPAMQVQETVVVEFEEN